MLAGANNEDEGSGRILRKDRKIHTVYFVPVLHVQERVEVDVAVEVDVGLDAPVPAVVLYEGVLEEEAERRRRVRKGLQRKK
jgi:hypothetical protein